MYASELPWSRSLALAFLVRTLLLGAAPMTAQEARSCQFSETGMIGDIRTVISGNAAEANLWLRVQLTANMAPDGTARIRGIIRVPDDPSQPGLGPYTPLLAIAKNVVGVECDDTNGNDLAGLVRLATIFKNVKTGERVPVVLATTGPDLDTSGTYLFVLQIGNESLATDLDVRVMPLRPVRRS